MNDCVVQERTYTNDNRQLGFVSTLWGIKLPEGLLDLGELVCHDDVELALGDTVTINNDTTRKSPVTALEELQTLNHHVSELSDHLAEKE